VVGDNKGLATWVEKLEQELAVDTVPEGWATTRQLAECLGVTIGSMDKRLIRLHSLGEAEKKTFKIQTTSGIRPVIHYKVKS
tara:strand:+ start:965 stop:1210 length:246 start_codon:yes stop_codon:yes gene_type:complete